MPNKKITNESKNDLIKKYLDGYSSNILSKEYGFKCPKSIIKILKKNNVKIRNQKESLKLLPIKFSKEEHDQIIKLNSNPLISLKEISEVYKCDPKVIKNYLINLNIYNPNKYDDFLIEKFKNIDNEEKAYWLGFLAADSYLSGKQLSLCLAIKDYNHLLKFKKFIGVDYNVSDINVKLNNNKQYKTVNYTVSCKKFIESLSKHNLISNKSFDLKMPTTIPNELIHHYLRGLIDGDGSYYINKKKNSINFSLISSISMCTSVRELLTNNCNLKYNKIKLVKCKNEKYMATICYCGYNNVIKIKNYLYKDSSLFLERKRELLDNYILNYHLH